MAVDPKDGWVEYNNLIDKEIEFLSNKNLVGVSSVTVFENDGETKFVTIKRENGKTK